jgi:hypothetical protein
MLRPLLSHGDRARHGGRRTPIYSAPGRRHCRPIRTAPRTVLAVRRPVRAPMDRAEGLVSKFEQYAGTKLFSDAVAK